MTGLLMILGLINSGDKLVLGLIAQPLQEELGLTASQFGLVGSLFFLAFSVGGFFAGLLDRWAPLKWTLFVLAAVWAATLVPMMVAAAFVTLIVSRIVLGLAEGPATALGLTAAYSWHPIERRSFPTALLTAAAAAAPILLASALAFLATSYGWRAALVAMSVLGAAWCVLWLLTWREGPFGARPSVKALLPPVDTAAADSQRVPWRTIFASGTFIGAVVAVGSMYALVSVVLTWLPSYFEAGLGYSRLEAGSLSAIPAAVGLVVMLLSGQLIDRLMSRGVSSRRLRGTYSGCALLFCGLAMASVPHIGAPAVAVLVVSLGYGFGVSILPVLNVGISQICPKPQLAGALGFYIALMSVGGVISPFLTGLIVDGAASPVIGYGRAFQLFGVVAVAAAGVALLVIDPARDRKRIMVGDE